MSHDDFQPPDIEAQQDPVEAPTLEDVMFAVFELRAMLDALQMASYAEVRKYQREATLAELSALLPGSYYMDPPDGGSVTVLEQFRRMADDAAKWRRWSDAITARAALEASDGWQG